MRCGVGDYTARLAEALGKLDDTSIAVLTSHEKDFIIPSNDTYEVFPVVREWKFSEFPQIARVVRGWRPDIIHMQFPTQGYRSGWLPLLLPSFLLLFNVKIVQTWHEYLTKENTNVGLIPNMLIPGGLIAVRPNYIDHLPPSYRRLIRHKRFRFIPNASALPRVVLSAEESLAVHQHFAPEAKSLLVYFGFIYSHKGVDLLLELADPQKDRIVLIGDSDSADLYHKALSESIQQDPWAGKVTMTGFLPVIEAARILAAADAVVLPFREGGGMWNSSLHGAAIQGTFVLTTSHERRGYDVDENVYYARPDDIEDMREALNMYAGRKNTDENIKRFTTWDSIAAEHIRFYHALLR